MGKVTSRLNLEMTHIHVSDNRHLGLLERRRSGAHGTNDTSTGCGLATWVGLSDYWNASDLLQTGSFGYIWNNGGLKTNYWLFVDAFVSGSATYTLTCMGSGGGNLISPGDTIDSVVLYNGMSGYYDVWSTDSNNGNQCSSNPSPHHFTSTVYFDNFVQERSETSGGVWTILPQFTNETLYGQVEWGRYFYPISRPNGDGWVVQDNMINGGTQNVCGGWWSSGTSNCVDNIAGGITVSTWGSYYGGWLSSANT